MELKIYIDSKYLLLTDRKSTNKSAAIIECSSVKDVETALNFIKNTENSMAVLYSESFEDLLTIVKSNFLYLEAAGGAVINEQNELLCMFRRGFWDLPKGKLDKGETPEIAAVREVQEETGVKNIILKDYITSTWHTYEHPKGKGTVLKQTYWYAMKSSKKEELAPETNEGITEVCWLSKEKVKEVVLSKTFPSIEDVINKLWN